MDDFVNNAVAAFALDLSSAVTSAVEETVGQSGSLAAAISYLHQEPNIGVEQLRAALDLSQPATVRLVNQLADSGLATRSAHHTDGRRVTLLLTATGTAKARRLLRARAEATNRLLAGLSEADQLQLGRLVGKIYQHVALSRPQAEHICRLCDVDCCPVTRCPVGAAVAE